MRNSKNVSRSHKAPSLWRAWPVSARPSPKWIERYLESAAGAAGGTRAGEARRNSDARRTPVERTKKKEGRGEERGDNNGSISSCQCPAAKPASALEKCFASGSGSSFRVDPACSSGTPPRARVVALEGRAGRYVDASSARCVERVFVSRPRGQRQRRSAQVRRAP